MHAQSSTDAPSTPHDATASAATPRWCRRLALVWAVLLATTGCGVLTPNAPSMALEVAVQQEGAALTLSWSAHDAWRVHKIERETAEGEWTTLMDDAESVRTAGEGTFRDDALRESGRYTYRVSAIYDEDEVRSLEVEALFDGVRAGTDARLSLPADSDGDGVADTTVDVIVTDQDGDGDLDAIEFEGVPGAEPMPLSPDPSEEGRYTVDMDGDGSPDLIVQLGSGEGDDVGLETPDGDQSHVLLDEEGTPTRVAPDGEPDAPCVADDDFMGWLGTIGSEARWPVAGAIGGSVDVSVVAAFGPDGQIGGIDVDGDQDADLRVLGRFEAGVVCAYELDVNGDGRLDLFLRGGLGTRFDTAADMAGQEVQLAMAEDGIGFDADGDGVPDVQVTDPLQRNLLGRAAGPVPLPASGALGTVRVGVVGDPPTGLDVDQDGLSDWSVEPTEPAGRYLVDTGADGVPDVVLDARWFELRFLDVTGTDPVELLSDGEGRPRGFDTDGDGSIDLGQMDGDGTIGVTPPGTERPVVTLDFEGGTAVDTDGDGSDDATRVGTGSVVRANLSDGVASSYSWWIDGVSVGGDVAELAIADVAEPVLEPGRRYQLTLLVEVPPSPTGPGGTVSTMTTLILEGVDK